MARDAFLEPLHENDPVNRPLGTGATYAAITEPNWPTGTNWDPKAEEVGYKFGLGLGSAGDPTRKVYHYNGTAWVQVTTLQVSDSLSWDQDKWHGTAENPTLSPDGPVDIVSEDKTTYTLFRNALRYSTYVGFGGTPIAGLNNSDLVLVHKLGKNPTLKTGLPLLEYCWQSITSSLPSIGDARATKIGAIIRSGELLTAYGVNHAMMMGIDKRMLNPNPPGGFGSVWPVNQTPSKTSWGGTGNIYLGSLIALPTSHDLTTVASAKAALSLETDAGVEVARGAQDYGIYPVEIGSNPSADNPRFNLYGEYAVRLDLGGASSATYAAWKRDVARILSACQVITNNHNSGLAPATAPIPGGSTGTLRQAVKESFGATTPIPAAPTSLTLGSPTGSSLTALWDASGVLGETGFDIQHRTSPGGSYPGSPQITTIVADAESHVITGLSAGAYAAQVRSKNDSGQSAWSNEATGTVPTGLVGRAVLASGDSNTDGTSFTTASYTPTANALVLAAIQARTTDGAVPNTPTLSGNGLTWVLVASIGLSTYRKLFLFRTMGAAPSAGALTIDFGAQTQTSCVWSIEETSGIDTTGTNGSGAVVQSATGSIN